MAGEKQKALDPEVKVPSAALAAEDDDARQDRAERGEAVAARAQAEVGAGEVGGPASPKDIKQAMPMEMRPGLPALRTGGMKPGDPGAPEVLEDNPALLAAVQDPYNERKLGGIQMVNTVDSYGNVVSMPVSWVGALLFAGYLLSHFAT